MPYLFYSSSTSNLDSFLKKKRKIQKRAKKLGIGLSLASFLLSVFIFLLFSFYLYFTIKLPQINFLSEKTEKEKTQLEITCQELEAELKKTLNIENLKLLIEEFKLTKPKDFYFLSIKKASPISLKETETLDILK